MNLDRVIEHKIPFKHWEFNNCLSKESINEINSAKIPHGDRSYDGTRAADHTGEGKDGKLRLFLTKENADHFPNLKKTINPIKGMANRFNKCTPIANPRQ